MKKQKIVIIINVPKAITLNGDGVERTVRLEHCQTPQDIMGYLDMCSHLGLTKESPGGKINDEGELMDIIERHFDLLTCYNCGKSLKDQPFPMNKSEVIGTMLCDPGEHNYPHSPDEPGGLYFECNACAEERRLNNKTAYFKAHPDKHLPKV